MKNNLKQTSLTISLVLALSMSLVPVAQTAPVTTPGGVVLDALVDDGGGLQSIISERPIWSNSVGPTGVTLDVTGGPNDINQVLFGLTGFDDPDEPEFLDIGIISGPVEQGAAPTAVGWTSSVDDDDADGDTETARWIVTPPEDTCAPPLNVGDNCANVLIAAGNTYRFQVAVTPEDNVDRSLQHWSITTSTPDALFEGTEADDLILFGFDDTLPTISVPVISWSGGLATVTFDVTDPASGETTPSPRPSGISTITNPGGSFNAECDASGGSLVAFNPADVANFGYGPASLSCTLSALDPAISNSVTLVAMDAAGNEFALPAFDLDTTAPAASLSFTDGAGSNNPALYHSDASPSVTFTFSDTESLVDADSIAFSVGGVAEACAASPCNADLSGLADGVHAITADVSDNAGNAAAQQTMTVHIDRGDPFVVSIAGAPDGDWTTTPPVLTLTADDATTSITQLEHSWSGVHAGSATTPGAGPFTVTPSTVDEGKGTLTYTLYDDAHTPNTFEGTYDLWVDTVQPVASLAFDDGTGITDPSLYHSELGGSVTFTFIDATSGIDAATIAFQRDGGDVGTCGAGSCIDDLTGLASGVYTYTASVSDVAGNERTLVPMTVHLDRNDPALNAVADSPPNAAGWYKAAPTVRASIADTGGAGVSDFTYEWSGATTLAPTLAGGTSLDVTPAFGQGLSTLTLTGADDAHAPNPAAQVTHVINFDDEAPSIDAFALAGGSIGSGGVYIDVAGIGVNFAASDPTTGLAASGVDTIELRLNGGDWVEPTSPWNLGGAPPEGTNTIDIRVTDAAGNVATDQMTFNVDTVHPVISNALLASDNGDPSLAKDGHVVTLTFDVDDAGVPTSALTIDAVGVAFDAPCSEPIPGSFSCDYTVQAADAGAVSFTIDAVDAAGNAATQVADGGVTVDNEIPVAAITGITGSTGSNGALNDRDDLTFSYTATDNIDVVDEEYSTDGGTTWSDVSGNSIDVSGLADGSYTLDLRAFDGAGNVGVDSFLFDVDDTAPVISAITLASDNLDATQATDGDMITLGFALDDVSGPLVVSIDIAGVEQATEADCDATIECVYTVIAGQNGPVTFDISASDAADNEATASGGGVTVDTSPPDAPTIALTGGTLGTNDWYTAVGDLAATITPGDETGSIEHQIDGGGWTAGASVDLSGLADGTHTLEARVVDAAGNIGAIDTETIMVDTTGPIFDTPLALTGGTVGDGGIYTDIAGLEAIFAASEIDSAPVVLEHSFDGITYVGTSSPLDLSGLANGDHTVLVRATNDAGLATVESVPLSVDTQLPTLSNVHIESGGAAANEANSGDTITLSWTPSETLKNVVVTIAGATAAVAGNGASITIDHTFAEGAVAFTIDYEDLAGTAGNQVTLTNDASSVTINFGDQVATTTSIVDGFLEIDDLTTITATTVWAEDPPGALISGDPYAFGSIQLFDASDLTTPLQTKTSNTAGITNFVVTSASVAETDFVVMATGYAPNPSRIVTETQATLDRSESVVWTRLVATGFGVADALQQPGDNEPIVLSLKWEHDLGNPATGLSLASVQVTVKGEPVAPADDARDLVPDTPKDGVAGGLAESGVTPGTYTAGLTHDAYESLRLNLAAGPIKEGTGATETNFAVPSVSDVYVHFVGAYVDDVTFANSDDVADTTGDFVNLDDGVSITAHVVYTPNYDPDAPNGVNTGAPVSVGGATVALFETDYLGAAPGYTSTANTIDENVDATATATTGASGDAVFTVDKTTFSQALLRDGANTYGLQLFATEFDTDHAQSIVQADVADLDFEDMLTFTALDLSFVDQAGAEETVGTPGDPGSRWWFGMDNTKGALDTDPTDADQATLDLTVAWRHDGQAAEGAIVKVHDGAAFLANGGTDLTGTSVAGFVDDLRIDPDDYGLDALVKDLEFIPVSAPEPATPTAVIDQSVDTFMQEFLWTRVAIFADIDFGSDGEVDLGSSVGLYSIPVYYHDETVDGEVYYFSADYDFNDQVSDLVVDEVYTGEMADSNNFGGLNAASFTSGVTPGLPLSFTVFGGCTDLSSAAQCAATQSIAQAGYHTYTAGMSVAPHNLPVDTATVEVLYTAVVIDATTDRLTAEVENDVELTAHAFYAHTKDVTGADLPDTGFGLGNKLYMNGVTTDIYRDGVAIATDLEFVDGELEYTLLAESAPGDHDFLVEATALAGQSGGDPCPAATDCSEVPLTLVYSSATMNRVWIEATIRAADGRTDFTDRNVQVAGRSVDVFFDVDVDDGTSSDEVEDTGNGYAFTAVDTNAADRFSRTLSTTPSTTAPTMQIVAPDGTTTFAASYVTGEGGCTTGCWKAVIGGFGDVAPDQLFDIDISVPVTDDSATDVGTTLADLDADAFEVDFTNIVLEVLTGGNEDWQSDLSEFWNDLGDAATFQVKATWAHDEAPALGATILVEDLVTAGDPLAGATATDADDDGTYDVSIPSPAASERRTYVLDVSSIPSADVSEAALTEPTVFLDDAASLTEATAKPELVHTRVLFDWTQAYDGGFANRGQSLVFDFEVKWEHDVTKIDVGHGWELTAGATETAAAVVPGVLSTGAFEVTQATSGTATLVPEISENNVDAPRGIQTEHFPTSADTVAVTWTAIQMDVDDALDDAPQAVDTPLAVAARASLEHDAGTYLEDVDILLLRTLKTTVAGGFQGTHPGETVSVTVIQPGTIEFVAEGVSYNPGTVLGGATAITSSDDDTVSVAFA